MAAPTSRQIEDANLSASIALPNAGNTVNTNGIDLGATTPWPTTEGVHIKISTTEATAANNMNINIRLMDSADDVTYANVANVANPLVIINEGSSVYAATTFYTGVPINVKRYLRATCTGEANGGNAADGTLTIALVF